MHSGGFTRDRLAPFEHRLRGFFKAHIRQNLPHRFAHHLPLHAEELGKRRVHELDEHLRIHNHHALIHASQNGAQAQRLVLQLLVNLPLSQRDFFELPGELAKVRIVKCHAAWRPAFRQPG